MKFLLILLIAGYAGYTNAINREEYESIGIFQAFAIEFMTPNNRYCSETTREQIMVEQNKAIECVKNIRYNSSFCDTFVNHFKPCIKGIQEEQKKCRDDAEGILSKNTILDSVIAEARYLCGVDGEHIFELLNPCVLRSARQSKECRKNVTSPIGHDPKVEDICKYLPTADKCFEDEVKKECENDITKSVIHDVLSVDVKPCNFAPELYLDFATHLRL